jgi:hypothetical protein
MIQPIKLRLTIVGAKVVMKNLDREFKTATIKANTQTRLIYGKIIFRVLLISGIKPSLTKPGATIPHIIGERAMPMMTNIEVIMRRRFAVMEENLKASSLSWQRYLENIGMNDADKAPSPNILLKEFGMTQAAKNIPRASVGK